MGDIHQVLSALEVFSQAPDKASIDRANSWLQEFQHSPEAWSTCSALLSSPQAPISAKLFAAQTFRSKVTYDLSQIAPADQLTLRNTLLSALTAYNSGPKTVIVQLCLAIVDLALQLPAWEKPVESVIDHFSINPSTVPTLLEFLTVLPEEVNSNIRIPITDAEFRERSLVLLTNNASRVLELLAMYVNAAGVTAAVQSQVFSCLYQWLAAGELSVAAIAKTPLFSYAFEALASDDLFDASVDIICGMVHETQEIDDNMPVIEVIVPRIIALRANLAAEQDDVDKIRGYARIFSEAGETYRFLLLHHTETFFPIVEAIGECSAYHDLDIVPITFQFWMRLAVMLEKKASINPLFLDAYKSLMSVIISHLHFPLDMTTFVGQDADNFRSFRHVMGDTLKDCCRVLGSETCLTAAYQQVANALARNAPWQEVEAPLFAMRSMGAEVDPDDSSLSTVPKVMDLIPNLPSNPRVRYAALMLVGRYTQWIHKNPQYISFLLQYVAAGFEDSDTEVCAAAGQAMKYLCQDCKEHLTEFLPTLHTFLTTTGPKLVQEDRRQVYEAIAYVISAMPMARAAESLKTFSLDILAQVHALSVSTTPPSVGQMEEVGNGLENLEVMLHVIQSYGDDLPPACQGTCQEAWIIFDALLSKYGLNYDLAERTTRVLRRGVELFGKSAFAVAPSVLARMSFAFEATGYSSFLWIAGKVIGRFGYEEDPNFRGAIQEIFERSTTKVAALLQVKQPGDLPDVLEDYIQMLLQLINLAPDILFVSSAFPTAFRCVMAGLTVIHHDIIFGALDWYRGVVGHDCMESSTAEAPPKFPIYGAAIRGVMETQGLQLVGCLLTGFTSDEFPDESDSTVISIFRIMVYQWGPQLLTWLPSVLEQLSVTSVPNQAKVNFMQEVTTSVNTRQYDKIKFALISLDRASRKARDRRRNGL